MPKIYDFSLKKEGGVGTLQDFSSYHRIKLYIDIFSPSFIAMIW